MKGYKPAKIVKEMASNILVPLFICASEFHLHYSRAFRYGKSEDEFGIIIEKEIERTGPCAFTIDNNGNVYIEDPVNGLIKVLNPNEDRIVKMIPIPGGIYDDIGVDEASKVYLLDRGGSEIITIDETGKKEKIFTDKKIHDRACWFSPTPEDLFLISEDFGELTAYGLKGKTVTRGIFSTSGVSYIAEWHDKSTGIVKVLDKTGVIKEIKVKRPNLASFSFLGEDKEGNLYLQIEYCISETKVGLEVIKLNNEGEKIATLKVPENDYYIWTSRLLFVDTEGRIYQVIPKKDCLKINIWTE